MSEKLALLGCGYHARGVAGVILNNTPDADIIFVDENARPDEKIMGFPVVKTLSETNVSYVSGAGDNLKRKKWAEGKKVKTIIAKDAVVCKFAEIGDACFIGHGCFIGAEAKVGKGCIINTHAVVEHSAQIGDFCNICPNATILGQCILGENVFVGSGAIIRNNARICSDVILGAGTVVINDITEAGTYVGCPAKKIK